ncbi:uncharacterized protein (DUF2147 family) [Epilithonimonas hungarica]|uniref:DUF2147 domain-containing protein n=1 Tax=Epilithonimonas hungarica TaxID=454006 RepID=UPI00278B6104|nr:DUF2147 domain-containing protein [Epilithonimonas hungarica]MDP9958024.1 uncharacterized protein (DUF2147 family) [Epilithonimonas hungarica]
MKKLLLLSMMILISSLSFAQKLSADKIIGNWESIDGDVKLKFEIFRQNGKYFGKLLWASNMFEADGKTPKKDFKNPDVKLRNRSRQNIINITNLTFDDGEYSGGKLYNPTDGNSYSLKAKLTDINNLQFRGYMGVSLLGKTMKFRRIR